MKEALATQLLAIAVFFALIGLHGAFFRLQHASWTEALTTLQGLYFVYFLVAIGGVERFTRARP